MIRHDCLQGSPEWDRLRAGIPTASCFHRIITPKTLKLSEQAADYMAFLLAERILGVSLEQAETDYMQLGHQYEEQAADAYCFERDCELEKVGFVTRDDGRVGCSPDRLVVGRNRAIEIKTHPGNPGIQVAAMLSRTVDPKYKIQAQGQCWIADLDGVDLVHYTPGFPQLVISCNRDDAFIASLSTAVDAFVETMELTYERLLREYGPFRQPSTLPREVSAQAQQVYDEWRPTL